MIVVTVNSGSTSIKLGAFRADDSRPSTASALRELAAAHRDGTTLDADAELGAFLRSLESPPEVIVHRVVHGGTRFMRPAYLDEAARAAIVALCELAPLHNPLAVRWIDAAHRLCGPEVRQVAVFDTAFFARLPAVAAQYALPPRLGVAADVRRYGFHGLAHEAMWRRWCELAPTLPLGGRLITVQLGGGCSISAIAAGRPLDTSMGFSPLEGLVMATRSGDVDPAVVAHLAGRLGVAADRVIESLNRESGLAGLSGGESNPAALLVQDGERARLAIELYCYRVRKYIGAYLAVLGGCDGIVFGGGVGEHVPEVRRRILAGMHWAGIELGEGNEASRAGDARISAADSAVSVWSLAVAEEPLMARAALETLADTGAGGPPAP